MRETFNVPPQFTLDPTPETILASGTVTPIARYPVEPPLAWFSKQDYDHAETLHVDPDGRVWGHGYSWDATHTDVGRYGRDLRAPRSRSGYSYFLTGHVLCAEGQQVRTGPIYIDCDHAPYELNMHGAVDHMAHTGSAVADVAVFEDRWGLQLAGSVRPHATPAQVRTLRGSAGLSPDFRTVSRGVHDLAGLVCVNQQGFNTRAIAASGGKKVPCADGHLGVLWDFDDDVPLTIVAVGMVRPTTTDPMAAMARRVDDLERFVASVRAEQAMTRFSGSATAGSLRARADRVVARAVR